MITEITKKELDSLGLFASALGHVGDGKVPIRCFPLADSNVTLGNFHTSIMYDASDPEQRAKVEKCVHDMVDRAIEMEGTCTVSLEN